MLARGMVDAAMQLIDIGYSPYIMLPRTTFVHVLEWPLVGSRHLSTYHEHEHSAHYSLTVDTWTIPVSNLFARLRELNHEWHP